jgi:hypothetical protein
MTSITSRTVQATISVVALALILAMMPMEQVAFSADGVEGSLHLAAGTALKLDLGTGRGLLTTDLGRPLYFDVPNPYLFENVLVGARIALRLDENGRAIKVMDSSIPDLIKDPEGRQPLASSMPEPSDR